jgi:hypothetical protein
MPGRLKPRCLLNSESCFLCGPVEWKIDPLGQGLGCEVRRLTALGNRFDDLGRKEGQPEQAPHVTTRNSFALCDNCDRLTRHQVVQPPVGAGNGFKECPIGSRCGYAITFLPPEMAPSTNRQ